MSNEPKTVFGQKVVVRNAKEKKALIMKRSDYKNASGNAQDKKDSETRDMIWWKVSFWENAIDALKREWEEETGVILHNPHPIEVSSRLVESGAFFIFVLRWCEDFHFVDGAPRLSDEHTDRKRADKKELQQVILRETVQYVLPAILKKMD